MRSRRLREVVTVRVEPHRIEPSRPTLAYNTEGWVYFLKWGGAIKIGHANNVETRMHSLAVRPSHVSCPYWVSDYQQPMTLLVARFGSFSIEKHLHQRFDYARIDGEWFLPSGELLHYISMHQVRVYRAYQRWQKRIGRVAA